MKEYSEGLVEESLTKSRRPRLKRQGSCGDGRLGRPAKAEPSGPDHRPGILQESGYTATRGVCARWDFCRQLPISTTHWPSRPPHTPRSQHFSAAQRLNALQNITPPRPPPAHAPSTPSQNSDTTLPRTPGSLRIPDTSALPDPILPIPQDSKAATTGTPPPIALVDLNTPNVPETIFPIPEWLHEDQQNSIKQDDYSSFSPGINVHATTNCSLLRFDARRGDSCEKTSSSTSKD